MFQGGLPTEDTGGPSTQGLREKRGRQREMQTGPGPSCGAGRALNVPLRWNESLCFLRAVGESWEVLSQG